MSTCKTCGHEHECYADQRFPIDAKVYLLHYGDGLSIADIGGALGLNVGRVAAILRSMDSTIMRSSVRPRPRVLSLRDAVGQLIASEILTDPAHRVDPDIRRGLKPRLTFADMRRSSERSRMAAKRRREAGKYDRLRIAAADHLRTYWLHQPEWVLATWRELLDAEKSRRNPTTYTVRMSCIDDDLAADSVEVPLQAIVDQGGTSHVVCERCGKPRMVVASHRTNAIAAEILR